MADISAPRRTFFRYMAREAVVLCDEVCGVRHVKLSDVAGLPPEALAALVPGVRPGVEIVVKAGRVCAQLPETKDALDLFGTDDQESLAVFNRFNRRNTIGQTAAEIAAATGCGVEETRARVQALFLRWLEARVCIPHETTSQP